MLEEIVRPFQTPLVTSTGTRPVPSTTKTQQTAILQWGVAGEMPGATSDAWEMAFWSISATRWIKTYAPVRAFPWHKRKPARRRAALYLKIQGITPLTTKSAIGTGNKRPIVDPSHPRARRSAQGNAPVSDATAPAA
jgi:hypothetical protein